MSRTLEQINADIYRCQWLRGHVHDLDAALRQDRELARLRQERAAALTNQQPAGRPS